MALLIILAAALLAAPNHAAPAAHRFPAWHSAASPACAAALDAALAGDPARADALWSRILDAGLPSPGDCPHAASLRALARAATGAPADVDSALRLLSDVVHRDPSDWVAAAQLGGMYELMARRIAAKGGDGGGEGSGGGGRPGPSRRSKDPDRGKQARAYTKALSAAASLLGSAHRHRSAWRAGSEAARGGYPQAVFAPPPTALYRGWGGALAWLGRQAAAQEAFAAGAAADTGWVTPWARPLEPLRLGLPGGLPRAFFTAADAPGSLGPLLGALEAALPAIRAEFAAALAAEEEGGEAGERFAPESAGLHDGGWGGGGGGGGGEGAPSSPSAPPPASGGWRVLPLLVDGRPQPGGCAAAPATCALLASHPALALARAVGEGQAKFSVLRPGTHVKPHAGPTNARLRVHCTLTLLHGGPNASAFRVGPLTRHWVDGECFAFDESFEHEVTTASAAEVAAAAAAEAGAAVVVAATAGAPAAPNPPLRASVRAVLLVDVANPFLADLGEFRARAVRPGAAGSDVAAAEAAWHAARAEAGGLRSELEARP